MQKYKKWKQSITCGKKTLGEWLADGGREETPKETEKCTQQPRNVTPIVLGTSDCTQLSKSNNEEDVDTNPITCQNDSQLENTQVILDVRESIEAMETMETHFTPSLSVTEPQDKSTSVASTVFPRIVRALRIDRALD